MQREDTLLLAVAAGVSLFCVFGGGLLAVMVRRRHARFLEMAQRHGLRLQTLGEPWTGPAARGMVHGSAVEVGRTRFGFVRFRTGTRATLPRGSYVHTQPFRHNRGGQRSAGMPAYDGSADDPETQGLFGNVPEIVLGDAELDRAFVIQADDELGMRRLLARADVRERMLSAVATGAHLRIREKTVELDVEPSKLGSAGAYDSHLIALVALAQTLEA